MIKGEKLRLTILLSLSLFLSIYLFSRTYVISFDGAFQYIPIAKDFISGLYGQAFGHNQQPLYSIFVALLSRLVSDYEQAGKLVSTIFGILMVFPLYFLGRRVVHDRVAFVSLILLVIHPYIRRFSADVLKESTYLFFLSLVLWFSWRTIQGTKRYPYLLIPLLSTLAYLVRPDGVEVFLVIFFYLFFIKKYHVSKERWIAILLLCSASLILFLPYLIYLRETTGIWTLSRAKTVNWFLGLSGSAGEISWFDRLPFTLNTLNVEFFSIYHPLYILLLGIGLWKRRTSFFREGEGFLLLFFIFHYLVLFLLVFNLTEWGHGETIRAIHFSGRYVLPLLLFSIYWVGEGLIALHHWIYNKIESYGILLRWEAKNRTMFVWGILFFLILTIVLPKTLKPQRYERIPEKMAGIWIKNQYGKGMTIFTTAPRIAYYAEGTFEYIDLNKDTIEKIKTSMAEKKTFYLAIGDKEIMNFHEVAEALKRDFIELKRFGRKGEEYIILYQIGR
jgi:hypothetical protein